MERNGMAMTSLTDRMNDVGVKPERRRRRAATRVFGPDGEGGLILEVNRVILAWVHRVRERLAFRRRTGRERNHPHAAS